MSQTQDNAVKVAIVGMDAFFGGCNGLDAFENSVYDNKQHFIPLPENRWYGIDKQTELLQEYGLTTGKAPEGAYIQDFEIDALAYKVPPNEIDKLNPQQLLMLKVADRALKDAKVAPNGNVAVIIAADTELSVHQLPQRWNLSWQIKDGLNTAEITLPPELISQLETIGKNSVHQQVDTGEFLSYVANIMASRISSLWNFSGPAFALGGVETATFKALELAEMLLVTGEVDAVVVGAVDLSGGLESVLLHAQLAEINRGVHTLSFDQKANGWLVGEGAGAVVLKRYDTALQDGDRIYSIIDGISLGQSPSFAIDSHTIAQVSQKTRQIAGVSNSDIQYLEVCGSGIPDQDEAEINGILQAYPPGSDRLYCAIGSVKANIGHTYVASGMASLIKTALCLYHKYIPGVPNWSGVKTPQVWSDSPFYVSTESRPWFSPKNGKQRMLAINSIGCDGSFAHVILSELVHQPTARLEVNHRYLQERPFYLFPITGDNTTEILSNLENLQQAIANVDSLTGSLKQIATQTCLKFQQHSTSKYAAAICGRNQQELLKEIESTKKGVTIAQTSGKDWVTPMGSYFTPQPLGQDGAIAYIYPAAVNSYVGIGRTLFRLFPKAFDDVIIRSLYQRAADVELLVFPRSLSKLTVRELEGLEKKLLHDSLAMFEAEVLFTRLITTIINHDFQVKPKYVFGYSLGETSMMVAQGVWSNFYQVSNTFNSSALFGDRLSGPKNAVREYWGIKETAAIPDDQLWSNYVLMASPEQVRKCLIGENHVYLTQINTPEEVLIAGEPSVCERVIKKLGCNAFPAPFDHVIHCPPMQSEYQELAKLYTIPSRTIPQITFYSSSEYQPIPINSQAIAHHIGKGLSQELDFPRLVNRVYGDGARIFIEAGPGGVCSRWIDKTLGNQPHLTVSLNRRGIDDHTSLVRALAKLLSHRVKLDLSPLYDLSSPTSTPTKSHSATLKKIQLGGRSMTAGILTEENQKLFKSSMAQKQQQVTPNYGKRKIINSLNPSDKITLREVSIQPMINIMDNRLNLQEELKSSELTNISSSTDQTIFTQPVNPLESSNISSLNDWKIPQYIKLSDNNSKLTKTHTEFLQSRQDFSKQMSEIIQLQLTCAENLLKEEK
jgi:PfaB family protein